MKYLKGICLLLVCLLLGGCMSGDTPGAPLVTLPPLSGQEEAPLGDLQEEVQRDLTFYLPDADGERLSPVRSIVRLHPFRWCLEEVLTALFTLRVPDLNSLPGEGRLSLSGTVPVEVSRGIATVNLSAAALSLTHEELYTVCQAICNTLCADLDLDGVNVLIGNVQPGLDISGSTPAGTLTPSADESLPTLWNRAESRRAAVQESRRFISPVTIYLPALNGSGILAELREVTFSDPSLEGLCLQILNELCRDTALQSASPLPDMRLLLGDEGVAIREGSGEKVLEISFNDQFDVILASHGIPLNLFTASLVYTLTTFTPGLTGVRLIIAGEPLTELALRPEDPEGTLTVQDGIFRRAAFSRFLYDEISLYMVRGSRLSQVMRAVPWYESRSPRTVFDALASGSLPGDSVHPLSSPLPEQSSPGDLVGISLSDDQSRLKITLSGRIIALIAALNPDEQALAVYAIVNSLVDNTDVKRVVIFSDETADDTLNSIELGGVFLKNEDILEAP